MLSKEKIWDIAELQNEKAGCLADELHISPLVTNILLMRGMTDTQSMREFLYGSDKPFHNPFLLKDMKKSVDRIKLAIAANELITVYGDYDVDGISASSLLYLYLKEKGANVNTYIPQRKSEGYGLNDEALKTIAAEGTTLVVTVDCGISGVREVTNAPQELDIIITDHHTVPEVLPPAYAIINAKQKDCQYPFKELSGVGIAFKLCQALDMEDIDEEPTYEELTELVALGTVADIVPLVGENRELVRRGLAAMDHTALVGLRALIKSSGCQQEKVTAERIGFGLAPRLNAVGRLEHAQRAVELLVTEDEEKASLIAEELNNENKVRQDISRQILADAEQLLAQEKHIDTAIVLAKKDWHQGVIGIVASRLVDKYHLPTILMSIDSNGMAKGSCRSIEALNLYEAIAAESDLLEQFGGHSQAAGLTLKADNVDAFRERFKAYVREHLKPEDYFPHQRIDYVMNDTGQITFNDLEQLELLEPCGASNMQPVFAFRKAVLRGARSMGKDHTHLMMFVTKGNYEYRGLMWNKATLLPALYDNMVADVAFQPRLNTFNGETNIQLHLLGIKQNCTLADYRNQLSQKQAQELLKSIVRVTDRVVVYANQDSIKQLSAEEELAPYLELHSYEDLLPQMEQDEQEQLQLCGKSHCCKKNTASLITPDYNMPPVVLYSMPTLMLSKIIKTLHKRGTNRIYLFYSAKSNPDVYHEQNLQYPTREVMIRAYKAIMNALEGKNSISYQALLQQQEDIFSANILQIMQELGFIQVNGDQISKGQIKQCKLQDSPLYVRLQQESYHLQQLRDENLNLTQHDLLRG